MKFRVTLLPGEGIGPEVMTAAIKGLQAVAKRVRITIELIEKPVGGLSIDQSGVPLTDDTLQSCYHSDAVLLGAVGGPKWEGHEHSLKPEAGLLKLRKALDLYANIRPAKIFSTSLEASPRKKEILAATDFVVLRELTGGLS